MDRYVKGRLFITASTSHKMVDSCSAARELRPRVRFSISIEPFMEAEMRAAMSQLRTNLSRGPDGVTNKTEPGR